MDRTVNWKGILIVLGILAGTAFFTIGLWWIGHHFYFFMSPNKLIGLTNFSYWVTGFLNFSCLIAIALASIGAILGSVFLFNYIFPKRGKN